ncbi:hypothetical protein ILYODFUR_038232 [Ilyodon furcidens]|uniref:Uncharacterized protein n=1 Tax=Ilyodon furcidens TaxID=33524 RepID=A0ABV0UR66_9TELE
MNVCLVSSLSYALFHLDTYHCVSFSDLIPLITPPSVSSALLGLSCFSFSSDCPHLLALSFSSLSLYIYCVVVTVSLLESPKILLHAPCSLASVDLPTDSATCQS